MIITEIDATTGETINREATNQEIAELNYLAELETERQVAQEEKAAAKSALLDKLGITEDEAKLLLS